MDEDLYEELFVGLGSDDGNRFRFTERAFDALPRLGKPFMLDIGCGSGGPTLVIAKLSGGSVVGVDTRGEDLARLQRTAREARLSDRVFAVQASMTNLPFLPERFDVLWSEGSIFVVGFERGLNEWRRYVKPKGFVVVHEAVWLRPDPPPEVRPRWVRYFPGLTTVEKNLETIERCGYDVISHFALPEDAWWIDYYEPLQKRVIALKSKYEAIPGKLAVLDGQQREIDMYRESEGWYGSAFFVLKPK
jgi:SAM-dependent methyltransferase